jgi:hypothetical protein
MGISKRSTTMGSILIGVLVAVSPRILRLANLPSRRLYLPRHSGNSQLSSLGPTQAAPPLIAGISGHPTAQTMQAACRPQNGPQSASFAQGKHCPDRGGLRHTFRAVSPPQATL